MARHPMPHRATSAALATLLTLLGAALVSGCSASGPAPTSAARGMSSGDAVGRSLFSPQARAMARNPRSGSQDTVASVIISPE